MGSSLPGLDLYSRNLARERDVHDEPRGAVRGHRVPRAGFAAHKREPDRSVLGGDDHRTEPADDLLAEVQLGARRRRLAQPQPEQAAVRLAPVVEPRDRLLPDVAALGERDGALVEARFLGDDRVVEVDAVARAAAL